MATVNEHSGAEARLPVPYWGSTCAADHDEVQKYPTGTCAGTKARTGEQGSDQYAVARAIQRRRAMPRTGNTL